jgi:hypothetical protein
MLTVKRMQRLWNAKSYQALFQESLAGRPETLEPFEAHEGWAALAASAAMIRLAELDQSYLPFYSQLLRALIAAQQADGGWGDCTTTALALHALSNDKGHGVCIDRGVEYLVNLQQPSGAWPAVPIRRMPADAFVTAFVLYELADLPVMRKELNLQAALTWCRNNGEALDGAARLLWQRAAIRFAAARPVQRVVVSRMLFDGVDRRDLMAAGDEPL